MKINIITDRNSWFNYYINNDLIPSLLKESHTVEVVNYAKDIPKGDILFALSMYQIIKKEYLNRNRNNIVIHESDLPKGKGWSPFAHQILEGKNEITFSLFEIDEKIDNGPIYFKDILRLNGYELFDELKDLQAKKRVEMCLKFVKDHQSMHPKPQLGQESFYPKRTATSSELDVNNTIAKQFNLLRIVDNNNYPAFFNYRGKRYKILIEKFD